MGGPVDPLGDACDECRDGNPRSQLPYSVSSDPAHETPLGSTASAHSSVDLLELLLDVAELGFDPPELLL